MPIISYSSLMVRNTESIFFLKKEMGQRLPYIYRLMKETAQNNVQFFMWKRTPFIHGNDEKELTGIILKLLLKNRHSVS